MLLTDSFHDWRSSYSGNALNAATTMTTLINMMAHDPQTAVSA